MRAMISKTICMCCAYGQLFPDEIQDVMAHGHHVRTIVSGRWYMAAESAVSILDSETDLHDDLIVRDLVANDMAACLDHLEPVKVLDGFCCLGNGVVDCIVSTNGG